MRNRFNLNEEEKNRIRGLHGIQLITEQNQPDEEEVDLDTEPTPEEAEPVDDGKITKREFRGLQKSAYKLMRTIEKNLKKTYRGKTINLYAEESSVGGEDIQTREGELESGGLKVRRINYPYGESRRGFIKNIQNFIPHEVEGRLNRVNILVSPAKPGAPPWIKWIDRLFGKDSEGYSKNMNLTIDCRGNGRMWLRQEKPGADFAKDESALKDTNVTNTQLMNDFKNSFCGSKEMGELKTIISELNKSKLVPDADYAQVDDQEGSDELV